MGLRSQNILEARLLKTYEIDSRDTLNPSELSSNKPLSQKSRLRTACSIEKAMLAGARAGAHANEGQACRGRWNSYSKLGVAAHVWILSAQKAETGGLFGV